MPTNRITKGNSLGYLVLQPGWTIENDGYGLLTCRASYIKSHGNDAGTQSGTGQYGLAAAPKRGDPFEKDGRLTCHRASSALNSNGLLVVSAEYVGIASGNMTTPEVSGRGATSTEPIASHPAFTNKIGGTKDAPLNGAVFNDSGAFKEFADAEYKKYGVKSYLDASFSINGHFYTADITVAKTLKESIGTTSSDGQWKNIQLIGKLNALANPVNPTWASIAWSALDESPQLLLNSMSVEDYGSLFKVGFDVIVSADGWDTDIYPYSAVGRPKRNNTK